MANLKRLKTKQVRLPLQNCVNDVLLPDNAGLLPLVSDLQGCDVYPKLLPASYQDIFYEQIYRGLREIVKIIVKGRCGCTLMEFHVEQSNHIIWLDDDSVHKALTSTINFSPVAGVDHMHPRNERKSGTMIDFNDCSLSL